MLHGLRRLLGAERSVPARSILEVRQLEEKLWGGFSRYAQKDLEALIRSAPADPRLISAAHWALARWYAVEENYQRALESIAQMARPENLTKLHAKDPIAKLHKGALLLEADCRTRLGEAEAARDLLSSMLAHQPDDPSLCLAMANTYALPTGQSDVAGDRTRLAWINRVYAKHGLIPIGKRDAQSPLSLDNLVAAVLNNVLTNLKCRWLAS